MCDVKWISEKVVAVLWMNRPQNASFHTICQPPQYNCKQVIYDKKCLGLGLTVSCSIMTGHSNYILIFIAGSCGEGFRKGRQRVGGE